VRFPAISRDGVARCAQRARMHNGARIPRIRVALDADRALLAERNDARSRPRGDLRAALRFARSPSGINQHVTAYMAGALCDLSRFRVDDDERVCAALAGS